MAGGTKKLYRGITLLYRGIALLMAFIGVLVLIFLPIFGGKNGLQFLDSLYNSISKGSAYYIPELQKGVAGLKGQEIAVQLTMKDEAQAGETAPLFTKAGAQVAQKGAALEVKGDLGAILATCLEDTDQMFANRGEQVGAKYGYEGRRVLFNWWSALKAAQKDLVKRKQFAAGAEIEKINMKGVECAYNYYGIEAQNIADKALVVLVSLLFYVVYTIWYGFAILYLFEGWGLQL
jgi:hypothetical protein